MAEDLHLERDMLHLHAVTSRDRNAATAAAGEVLSSHGWIVDVVLYSNKMACFQLSSSLDDLAGLRETLAREDVILTDASVQTLAELAAEARLADPVERARERFATVELTFVTAEPDLRRELPRVPG